jgi:hypothetical protein
MLHQIEPTATASRLHIDFRGRDAAPRHPAPAPTSSCAA